MVELDCISQVCESPVGKYDSHNLHFSDVANPKIRVRLFVSELTLAMAPDPLLLSTEEEVAAFRDVINQALLAYMNIRSCQQNGVSVRAALEQIQAQYRAYRAKEN